MDIATLQFFRKCVIPDDFLFVAKRRKKIDPESHLFSFGKNQMGFRINFLSPRGEEEILRNDGQNGRVTR
jgi:hypothetical protein